MRPAVDPAAPPRTSLWRSLRDGFSGLTDAFGRFVAANLAWTLVVAGPLFVGTAYPPAYAAAVLLIPVTCGLLRMAGQAARGRRARLSDFADGVRHRWWRHLLLGAGQTALMLSALLNVGTGLAGDGLLAAMVAIAAAYVVLAVCAVSVTAWPILLDPQRPGLRVRAALRLALAVVARRPLGVLALVLVQAALLAATLQTVVLGLVLPALGALVAASYVLPLADRLEG